MRDDQHSEGLKKTTARNLDRISNLKLEKEIEALEKELVVLNKILEQFHQEKKIQEEQLGLLEKKRENIDARVKEIRAQKDSEKTLDSVAYTEYSNLSENSVIKSEAVSFGKMKFQIEASERILLESFSEIKNKIANETLKIDEKKKLINTLKEKKEMIALTSYSKKKINKKEYIEKIIQGESVESVDVEQPEELITQIKFSYMLIKQKELTPSFFQSDFFEELEKKFPGKDSAQKKLQALAKHIKERKNSRSMKAVKTVLDLEQKKHNPEIKKLEKPPSTVAASVDGDTKTEAHALETIEQDHACLLLKDFINKSKRLDPEKILNNKDGFKKALEKSLKTAESDFELGIILSQEESRIKKILNEFLEKGVALTDFGRIQEIKAGIIFLDQKNRDFLDVLLNKSRSILKFAVISFSNLESKLVLEQYRAISDIVPGLNLELIDYAKTILSEVQVSKSDFTEIKKVNSVLKYLETILEEKEFLKIKSDFINNNRSQFEEEVVFLGVGDKRIKEWGAIFNSGENNLDEFLVNCQINWVILPLPPKTVLAYQTVLLNNAESPLKEFDEKHRYIATLIKNSNGVSASFGFTALMRVRHLENFEPFKSYYEKALNFLYQESVNEAIKTHNANGSACSKLKEFAKSNFLYQVPFSNWEISKKILNVSKNMDLYFEITKKIISFCHSIKSKTPLELTEDFFLLASKFCDSPDAILFISEDEANLIRWHLTNNTADINKLAIMRTLPAVLHDAKTPNINGSVRKLLEAVLQLTELSAELHSFLIKNIIKPYKKFSALTLENGLIDSRFTGEKFPVCCLAGKINPNTLMDVNYEKYILLVNFQNKMLTTIENLKCFDSENPLSRERFSSYFGEFIANLDDINIFLKMSGEEKGVFANVMRDAKKTLCQMHTRYCNKSLAFSRTGFFANQPLQPDFPNTALAM